MSETFKAYKAKLRRTAAADPADLDGELAIDRQIYLDQPDGTRMGPYTIVDNGESRLGPYIVLRMDAEGNDASMHEGEQDVDWEYVTVDLDQLMGQTIVPA